VAVGVGVSVSTGVSVTVAVGVSVSPTCGSGPGFGRESTPPLLIEAVAGQIALQRGPQSVPLQLVPLDGCGRPRPTRAAAAPSDRAPAVYELVAAAGTAWYVLSARTNSAP